MRTINSGSWVQLRSHKFGPRHCFSIRATECARVKRIFMKGNVKEYKRWFAARMYLRVYCCNECFLRTSVYQIFTRSHRSTLYKMTILLISEPSCIDSSMCDYKLLLLLWETCFLKLKWIITLRKYSNKFYEL